MSPRTIACLGLVERAEYQPLIAWLAALCQPGVAELLKHPQPAQWETATLIAVFESHPDEWSAESVRDLIAAAPLARIVCITGPWSEAVGRTRTHWPAALRVPWWSARRRLTGELSLIGVCPVDQSPSALPVTASRDETWRWEVEAAVATPVSSADCSVDELDDPAFRDMLSAWLTAQGHTLTSSETANVVCLLDLDPWSDDLLKSLQTRRSTAPTARLIGLSAWSTPDLLAAVAPLGILVADKLDLFLLNEALATVGQPAGRAD